MNENQKPSVLLIEAHHEPSPADLQYYIDWLTARFNITNIHISNMNSIDIAEDCIVVTGSKWQLASDPVPEILLKLYKETTKPLLAVCWGHQALAHAWGGHVVKKSLIEQTETIRVDHSEKLLANTGLFFSAYQSHYEHVVKDGKLKKNFEVLAFSDSCNVEVIKHKTRPLWGVQFHPERSGVAGRQLADNFARIAANPPVV